MPGLGAQLGTWIGGCLLIAAIWIGSSSRCGPCSTTGPARRVAMTTVVRRTLIGGCYGDLGRLASGSLQPTHSFPDLAHLPPGAWFSPAPGGSVIETTLRIAPSTNDLGGVLCRHASRC